MWVLFYGVRGFCNSYRFSTLQMLDQLKETDPKAYASVMAQLTLGMVEFISWMAINVCIIFLQVLVVALRGKLVSL